MDLNKDVYGQEVRAYLQGKKAYEIVERDDGFVEESGGPSAYFAEFKDWIKTQKQAIQFTKGRVVDIGAGAGRNSLYLQEKGFPVTAIDNSPLAVKVCRKRGIKNVKEMPVERIGRFKSNSFDTVIMFGNNFGVFGNFHKARKLLKKFHRVTSSDALILAESTDIYKTDDRVHLEYHKINKKRGRMPGQLSIRLRFKKYIGDWFDYLLVSKKEMKKILEGTGWKVREFIESDGPSYIAVIEKEK